MRPAPSVRQAFSPLDEELELLSGHLTPRGVEALTRLGTWIPFEKAAGLLGDLLGVQVSKSTAARYTERHGAAYVAVQTAAVIEIEKKLPAAPAGPAKQLLSVDGAMVPLTGGEWAEVKTLVLGEIAEPVIENGESVVHARELSYFSRLTDAETFGHLALVETHHRGVENAGKVLAVTDGAVWIQGFVDYHRPDAVRILDFPHAAEYISAMANTVWGLDSPTAAKWAEGQRHKLKHQGAQVVLPELRTLVASHAELPELAEKIAYLEKRQDHMQYPYFQAQGWPIGSGAVESGNKLVVEARLKGSGMHWARHNVNPMLGLRNAVCNDRWSDAWSQITVYHRQQQEQRCQTRRQHHLAAAAMKAVPTKNSAATTTKAPAPQSQGRIRRHWRPARYHPWRRYPAAKK